MIRVYAVCQQCNCSQKYSFQKPVKWSWILRWTNLFQKFNIWTVERGQLNYYFFFITVYYDYGNQGWLLVVLVVDNSYDKTKFCSISLVNAKLFPFFFFYQTWHKLTLYHDNYCFLMFFFFFNKIFFTYGNGSCDSESESELDLVTQPVSWLVCS